MQRVPGCVVDVAHNAKLQLGINVDRQHLEQISSKCCYRYHIVTLEYLALQSVGR